MASGKAVWADFWCKINSKTSLIDLDRFRSDPVDPKISQKLQTKTMLIEGLVSYLDVS